MQQIWCQFGAVTHRGFGARQNRHLVGIESDMLGGRGARHFCICVWCVCIDCCMLCYVLDICYNIKSSPALVIMVVVCGSLQNKFSSESHKRKDSSF